MRSTHLFPVLGVTAALAAASLMVVAPAQATRPGGTNVVSTFKAATGNGCPSGSYDVPNMGNDVWSGGTIVRFNKFIARQGPGASPAENNKSCRVTVSFAANGELYTKLRFSAKILPGLEEGGAGRMRQIFDVPGVGTITGDWRNFTADDNQSGNDEMVLTMNTGGHIAEVQQATGRIEVQITKGSNVRDVQQQLEVAAVDISIA